LSLQGENDMKKHRGIALFIAMIFVLSLSALILTNLKRIDSMIESSYLEVNLLQTNALKVDIANSLGGVIKAYGIADQEDLDKMIDEAPMIPITIDDVRIQIMLEDADNNRLDINKLARDNNSSDWQEVFKSIANQSNISGDVNQLLSMIKNHITNYGEIRKESVFSRLLGEYANLYGDSGLEDIRKYISTQDSGIVWDKADYVIQSAIMDVRSSLNKEALSDEKRIITAYLPKIKCKIKYTRGSFESQSSFLYTINADTNSTQSVTHFQVSF
jgi:hypothetical protein